MTGAAPAPPGWRVEHLRGTAGALHARAWPEPLTPTVWVLEVERPALVLGSTQATLAVDAAALDAGGIEVAYRRSGGGAVVLVPRQHVWIDVLIPATDVRWDTDVNRSFHWLGEAWVAALAGLGVVGEVHRGRLHHSPSSRLVCFAGLGPGEVTVAGRKAVGLSQRRTRAGARFQTVVYRSWDPAPLGAIDGVDPDDLPPVAVVDRSAAAIESALLAALA